MRIGLVTRRLLVVLAVAVVTAPWAVVARTLVNAKPVATSGASAARSIVWGGRVFSTKADLAAWLRSRGTSYDAWAARHPDDRAILEHTKTRAAGGGAEATGTGSSAAPATSGGAAGTGSSAAPATSGGAAAPRSSASPSVASPAGSSVSWLSILLLTLASMTMLAALVPSVVPVLGEDIRLTETHRAYLFAAGLSVSVGVLVAGALS
jgi:hypothetical protein